MIDTNVLINLATNASFTHDAILIDASHLICVRKLLVQFENHFASWAASMDKKETVIKTGTHEHRIPASIAVQSIDLSLRDEPNRLLWFANVAISPGLLIIANDLMNNPRRAAVVRLRDEMQIIMSDECKVLNPGHTLQEACTWTRAQFWDASDLDNLRKEIRQRSDTFEFTWKSFDPSDPTKTNDLEITTRYKLFDGGDGEVYQLSENLGMREIVGVTI